MPTRETGPVTRRTARHARTLQELIPGILQVETGQNLSPNHRGYTYGFIVQFANEEALKAYATHPEHQPVSQELQSLCESIIDFDIPVGVESLGIVLAK